MLLFCRSIGMWRSECVAVTRLTFSGKENNSSGSSSHWPAQYVCSYRMTLRARALDHTPMDSHARAFLHLILIVAFCAHFNSIMHNKSWTFHFCSQVCYIRTWHGTLKLCHDPWISMQCKRPDQKFHSLMESMKRCCTKRSKENRKFSPKSKTARPWSRRRLRFAEKVKSQITPCREVLHLFICDRRPTVHSVVHINIEQMKK